MPADLITQVRDYLDSLIEPTKSNELLVRAKPERMQRQWGPIVAVAAAALVLLVAAPFLFLRDGEPSSSMPVATEPNPTVDIESLVGVWGMDSMTLDGKSVTAPAHNTSEYPGFAFWVRFDANGTVDGQLPCNSFLGQYEGHGSVIEWDPYQTAALCVEPEDVMDSEAMMTRLIFSHAVDVTLDEGTDALTLSGGGVAMVLHRLD